MTANIKPFNSDREKIDFARLFLRGHVKRLHKDIGICLTANKQGRHAYFPALMTCIAFLDLMSGLHAGKLKGQGFEDLYNYAQAFMDSTPYDRLRLAILYECFRHKIAHLAHPYVVFHTVPNSKLFPGPQKRVTWKVCAKRRQRPALELKSYSPPRTLKKTLTPWPVEYDHRIIVSIHHLKVDAVNSIYGLSGYLAQIEKNRKAMTPFAKCMHQYYSR